MWIWNIPKCGCHISLSRPALARPLVVSCQARWTVNVRLSYQVDSRWSKVQLKGFGILKFETLMRRQSLWTPEWRQKPCEGRCLAGESTWPCQCVCQDTWYFYYPLDSTLFGSFAPTLPGIPLSDLHQGNECVQMGKKCVVPCCPYQNSTHLKGPGCLNLGQLRNWHCMDAGFSDTGNHESLCVGMLKGWDMLKLFQYYLQALIPWHLMTSSSQCSALVKFYWIKDLPEAEAVLLESNSELSCHSCHTSCRGFVTKTPAARNNLVAWVFRTSQLKTPIAANRNFLKEVKGWDVGRIQRWLVADWSSCGPGW